MEAAGEVLTAAAQLLHKVLLDSQVTPERLTVPPAVSQLNCAAESTCLEMLLETKVLLPQEISRVMLICLLGQSL